MVCCAWSNSWFNSFRRRWCISISSRNSAISWILTRIPALCGLDPPESVPWGSYTSPSNVTDLSRISLANVTRFAVSASRQIKVLPKIHFIAGSTSSSYPTSDSAKSTLPGASFSAAWIFYHTIEHPSKIATWYHTDWGALLPWILFNGIKVHRRRNLPLSSNSAPTTSFSTTTYHHKSTSALEHCVDECLHCTICRQHRFQELWMLQSASYPVESIVPQVLSLCCDRNQLTGWNRQSQDWKASSQEIPISTLCWWISWCVFHRSQSSIYLCKVCNDTTLLVSLRYQVIFTLWIPMYAFQLVLL